MSKHKTTSTARSKTAKFHAQQLVEAKRDLMGAVNRYIAEQRNAGNKTIITPQIQNLLRETKYTAKTLSRLKTLTNNPKALQDYIVVSDKDGNILSGETGLNRWRSYVNSSLFNPSDDIHSISNQIIANFEESLTKLFTDETALDSFIGVLNDAFVRVPRSFIGNIDYTANYGEAAAQRMAKSAKYEEHTITHFLKENEDLARDISSAIQRSIQLFGEEEVARRIESNPGLIDDLAVAVSSAYRVKASSAAHGIIDVLLGEYATPADYSKADDAVQSINAYDDEFYE